MGRGMQNDEVLEQLFSSTRKENPLRSKMRERRYWEWLVFVLAMRIKRKGKGAVPVLSITRGEPDANRASGLVNRSPAGPLSCYRHLCRHPLSYSYLFCFCHYYPFLSYSLTASPFPLSCYVSFLLPFSSLLPFASLVPPIVLERGI